MVNVNKELAIQHFKSKHNWTWAESSELIILENKINGYEKQQVQINLKNENKKISFEFWNSIDQFDVILPLEFLEDLLSILHLYYIK